MKLYWPGAIVVDDNNEPYSMFTYDSCLSVDACESVFKCWQDLHNLKLLAIWIDVVDTETNERMTIKHRCLVNVVGHVEKLE